MLPLAAVLAEFQPLPPSSQWAIVSLLSVTLIVVLIWSNVRRQPPVDSELAQIRTKLDNLDQKVADLEEHREEDLRAQRTYTRETTRELFEKLDRIAESFASNIKSVERAVGQLEGKVQALGEQMNAEAGR